MLPEAVDPECLDTEYIAADGECDVTFTFTADPGILILESTRTF